MLVGTRPEDWRRDFSSINENDRVLVYDFDQYEFFGPFRITKHKHGRPFEQDAWSGKFPSQARIESVGTTKSIGLQQISDEIGHSRVMRPGSSMPHAFVDGDSAANLSDLFGFPATTKPSTRPATSEPTPEPKVSMFAARPNAQSQTSWQFGVSSATTSDEFRITIFVTSTCRLMISISSTGDG